uniref:28S rRNA (uridine-N(3))-methyltransferase n=1 Tax=Hucho hucho TaxID=62062 RepID=A0A4W5LFT4_9TELE
TSPCLVKPQPYLSSLVTIAAPTVARKEIKKQIKESKLIQQLDKQKQEEEEKTEAALQQSQRENRSGRSYTVSVALPGSVLDNAQSTELRTYLAGQIARACVVFCVDEIIVFDEQDEDVKTVEGEFNGVGKKGQACIQLARILQFLECPHCPNHVLVPSHLGLLNPLDSPHHMRKDDECEYREGVVLDRPSKPGKGSLVNCGMWKEVQIDKQLQSGLRVTVHMNQIQNKGRSTSLLSILCNVFTECPHKEGYDLTIGTSEKGGDVDKTSLSPFKHMLVVFGGLQGLEASVDADQNLEVTDPSVLFDLYLNTCPNQGSRTIRTEEAILISMSILRQKITAAFPDMLNGS